LREIVVVGRRGPAQASFTTPELAEIGELAGADVIVDPKDLEGAEPVGTNAERNMQGLRGFAQRAPTGKPKTIPFRLFLSPAEVHGEERVEEVGLARNRLVDDKAVPTDEKIAIPCALVVRSVGYRGVALPGVPFDETRGTIANEGGRVLGAPSVYCAG